MKPCDTGVIIDALTVCCEVANGCYMEELSELHPGESIIVDEYELFRVQGRYYDYTYNILINDIGQRCLFGQVKFGVNHSVDDCNVLANGRRKVWLTVENRQLYTPDYRRVMNDVMCRLGLVFHNVTTLDLCFDLNAFNVPKRLKRLIRNKDLKVILNGKVCRDRDIDRPEIHYDDSGSLNRDKYLSVSVKQKKALKNKSFGVTVCCYDKRAEIQNSSGKEYILDYYGNPKKLFRTEVHLNNEQIKEYMSASGTRFHFGMMTNEMLEEMYFYFLNSVIRFRKGKKSILWEDILRREKVSARVNNNPPCHDPPNRGNSQSKRK